MSQAGSRQILQLKLIPMQIPEAGAVTGIGAERANLLGTKSIGENLDLVTGVRLVIRPGEPSEMLVLLENLGNRMVQLRLEIEGNFPPEWCRLGREGQDWLPIVRWKYYCIS